MKKILLAALAVSVAASAALGRAKAVDPLARLTRLYESGRYFELRDAVALLGEEPAIEMEFFRGAVDEIFNRLDPAVIRLRRFLSLSETGPASMMNKEAWVLLADAFRRLGRYRQAAEARREILVRYGAIFDKEERANFENQIALWSALAGVPPQTVEGGIDTTISMTDRRFPVHAGGRTFFVGYDTGSNLSVLYRSIAEELDVPTLGPATKIQTSTGKWIEGQVGVVPEMKLGPIVIRNAVFFILPDEFFASSPDRFGVGQLGLLGAPVLEALKEITETRDGKLIIPALPRPRTGENMCFCGFMPLVEVRHRGARLSLCLDTGSPTTRLYPPFLRRYAGEIKSRSRLRPSLLGGVGNSRKVPVHILDWFLIRTGGMELSLRRIVVQTKVTHTGSRYFDGTLGLDVLDHCSRMTFNFESMSFILE